MIEIKLPFSIGTPSGSDDSLCLVLSLGILYVLSSCCFAFLFSLLPLKHLTRRHKINTISTKIPPTAIQVTVLALKNFLGVAEFSVTGEEGPLACFQGCSEEEGALAKNEGAGAGDDGIMVVLKGFPSFLHSRCHH